jgi:serine/threonine protein kinase/Tol biopolymer transport system component
MGLTIGIQLGSYEVTSLIGKGGMGEVYRARDMKLKREVAIKILPDEFARDTDRITRFQREAEVLASLSHPNIAGIYDLQQTEETRFLVMELVEGETLADRIKRGPLPIEEALQIGKSICEALEAAHEKGIVHRDLKPANIKITPDGTVKVLDFGLAKIAQPQGSAVLSNSPTLLSGSMPGMIVGTAAYMSPEQAKGKPADKRSDIWAFGCVVYEMLTGRRAFEGEDVADTLAFVLTSEVDWSALPSRTPAPLERLIRRSLMKDRRQRLADVADARLEIEEVLDSHRDTRSTGSTAGPQIGVRRVWLAAGAALVIVGLVLGVVWSNRAIPTNAIPVQFAIPAPASTSLLVFKRVSTGASMQLALSPDGRRMVFSAVAQGQTSLWVRALADAEAVKLRGTEDATYPFWSPDGRFVAFFADGRLKTVPVGGGTVVVLCEAAGGVGGSWNDQNVILFADVLHRRLQRVSASGGVPTDLTNLSPETDEVDLFPQFLPDGRNFIYIARTLNRPLQTKIGSLDSSSTTTIPDVRSVSLYAARHLFFVRDSILMARPFDLSQRRFTGEPQPVAADVVAGAAGAAGAGADPYAAAFSVSEAGVVAYGVSTVGTSHLVWKDRAGREVGILGESGRYTNVSLSHSGDRVAVSLLTGTPPRREIWTIDIRSGATSQITFESTPQSEPTWSPDDNTVVFNSGREGGFNLSQAAVPGGGSVNVLLKAASAGEGEGRPLISDWSDDGRYILYTHGNRLSSDIWTAPVHRAQQVANGQTVLWQAEKPMPFVRTPADEDNAEFSPGARWVAYQSNESGRQEIYVQPFPATGAKYRISRDGGMQPMWRRDGQELYFLALNGDMMAVALRLEPRFEAATPRALFSSGTDPSVGTLRHTYAVARDGRFLLNVPDHTASPAIKVLVNWPEMLQH